MYIFTWEQAWKNYKQAAEIVFVRIQKLHLFWYYE